MYGRCWFKHVHMCWLCAEVPHVRAPEQTLKTGTKLTYCLLDARFMRHEAGTNSAESIEKLDTRVETEGYFGFIISFARLLQGAWYRRISALTCVIPRAQKVVITLIDCYTLLMEQHSLGHYLVVTGGVGRIDKCCLTRYFYSSYSLRLSEGSSFSSLAFDCDPQFAS